MKPEFDPEHLGRTPAQSYRQCPSCGKRGYVSERLAREGNQHASFRIRAYQCDSGLWHVTNQDKRDDD